MDVFIAAIGTGGTLLGVAEVLKKKLPQVRIIGIQPASSKDVLLLKSCDGTAITL